MHKNETRNNNPPKLDLPELCSPRKDEIKIKCLDNLGQEKLFPFSMKGINRVFDYETKLGKELKNKKTSKERREVIKGRELYLKKSLEIFQKLKVLSKDDLGQRLKTKKIKDKTVFDYFKNRVEHLEDLEKELETTEQFEKRLKREAELTPKGLPKGTILKGDSKCYEATDSMSKLSLSSKEMIELLVHYNDKSGLKKHWMKWGVSLNLLVFICLSY